MMSKDIVFVVSVVVVGVLSLGVVVCLLCFIYRLVRFGDIMIYKHNKREPRDSSCIIVCMLYEFKVRELPPKVG